MAYDKVVDSQWLDGELMSIANAISNKLDSPPKTFKFPQDFVNSINSIKKDTLTPTEEKTVNIVENGRTVVIPNQGKTLSKVTVNVNVPTGGTSDVEIVEFIPPSLPTFKHQTGTFELWGWGIKDADVAWMSEYYTFHGSVYANAIDDTDHAMTLTIVDGRAYGIPEMTRGKCLAVYKN